MTKKVELKRCPFCGSFPELHWIGNRKDDWGWVMLCRGLDCHMTVVTRPYHDKRGALAAGNRRKK